MKSKEFYLEAKSLFVKKKYFSVLYNICFYTQLALVFQLLVDCYIVRNHTVVFCFFLLQKDLNTFHKLFLKPFFVFLVILADEPLHIFIYVFLYMHFYIVLLLSFFRWLDHFKIIFKKTLENNLKKLFKLV